MLHRRWIVLALLASCRGGEQTVAETDSLPPVPRVPVAFVGAWLRVAPIRLRGDTIQLLADSTARGIIPLPPNRLTRLSHWKVRHGSRDPVDTRQDWRQGHSDGGDADCVLRDNPACVSLPLLCLGASAEYLCQVFIVTSDSLLLADGQRYVRLHLTPPPEAGTE